MILRGIALGLAALSTAHGGLRFLAADGGPLPVSLEPLAAAIAEPAGDMSLEENRAALAEDVVRWANAHDHPVFYATVDPPDREGVTRVLLTDGRTGQVTVEGGTHLPAARLARGLRLQPGSPLRGQSLQAELDWLQRNPFHGAAMAAAPGAGGDTADIAFTLTNDYPLSLVMAYDNQGVAPLGEARFRAAAQWGNALGLDQQMTAQYITAADPDAYTALAGEWIIPLPWRHELRLSGAWAETGATSDFQDSLLNTGGTLRAAQLRYHIPFRLTKTQTADVFAGFDYRKFDTDVTFGGSTLFENAVEAGMFVLGTSWRRIAGRDSAAAGLEIAWSPGGLFSGADDDSYEAVNPDASAAYWVARGYSQTRHTTESGWQWLTRAGGQAASGPLLPSEDYSRAGATAVRGYAERSVRGKHGAVLSSEILTPSLPLPASLKKPGVAWQLAAFADGGWAAPSFPGSDSWLLSAGAGLRARAGKYCTVSCEVAWPLLEPSGSATAGGPRLHLSAQLSF